MKVQTIKTEIDAEQYLEDATNWYSLRSLVSDILEDPNSETGERCLRITYDNRDFYLEFGDWVVRYPDGTLHFFSKQTFDELFQNPFVEPLQDNEIYAMLGEPR